MDILSSTFYHRSGIDISHGPGYTYDMENKEEIREKLIAVNKGGLKLRAIEEGSGVPIASLKQFISICSMGRQKIKALGDYLDSVNIGTERPVPIMDPEA